MKYVVVYLDHDDLYVEEFNSHADAMAWINGEGSERKAVLVESNTAIEYYYHT